MFALTNRTSRAQQNIISLIAHSREAGGKLGGLVWCGWGLGFSGERTYLWRCGALQFLQESKQ